MKILRIGFCGYVLVFTAFAFGSQEVTWAHPGKLCSLRTIALKEREGAVSEKALQRTPFRDLGGARGKEWWNGMEPARQR